MKDKLLKMIKTPIWKNSIIGGVIFSTLYNLFFTDYTFTLFSLVSIVIATAIGSTIMYFLEKRYFLSNRINKVLEKYPQLRTGSFQVVVVVALAFAAMIANSVAFSETHVSESVKQFADTTWRWGSLAMMMAFFAECLMYGLKYLDIFTALKSLFKRLIMLSMIIALVRYSGDGFIDVLNSEPLLIAQGLAVFLCILFAFKVVDNGPKYARANEFDNDNVRHGIPVAAGVYVPLLTDRDVKHVRTHEAGHALIHALLKTLPDGLMASVKPKHDGSLGRVFSSDGYDHLKTADALEWIMFRHIAGFVAEEVAHDNATTGCADDLRQWEWTARHYLSNGFGSFYYQSPVNELEVNANSSLLKELKASQIKKVKHFFQENEALLGELADELGEKEVMDKHDLSPFLERASMANLAKVDFTFFIEE